MLIDRDRDLVETLRRRDPRAAERLLRVYGERAYRLAVRITRTRADAEEVVQDAVLTVVRKIDGFRGEAAFGSWFYRIVANTAYQTMRGRRRRQDELRSEERRQPGEWSMAAENPARQTEVRLALSAAIEELPFHYRTVFVLRDLQGLSHGEIGQRLKLSAANVKTRIHRARSLLRGHLADLPATPRSPVAV